VGLPKARWGWHAETGELRSKIDGVWNAFWAGGIANPLEVIEQITYLLFMRGLDEAHTQAAHFVIVCASALGSKAVSLQWDRQ
jgi:hypothetical protein